MGANNSQPVGNKTTEQVYWLCLPFATLARWARICFSDTAEFFRHLFCSTRRLSPGRISLTPRVEQIPNPHSTTEPTKPEPPITIAPPAMQIPRPGTGQRCLPSHFIDFYNGAINDNGITLAYLIETAKDDYLEEKHNWVQWAFPLRAPGLNSSAPLLDQDTIDRFRADPHLQSQLVKMFKRVLHFYGLKLQEETGTIVKGENFALRAPVSWLKPSNHNHLRISRILDCLQLLQAPTNSLSVAFFRCLKQIQKETPAKQQVCAQNFDYWQKLHPIL